jgi:hypothetical protein
MYNRPPAHGVPGDSFGDRKKMRIKQKIALFCPFRHLFSSTYNTAILLRTQTV